MGSEMCIRDRMMELEKLAKALTGHDGRVLLLFNLVKVGYFGGLPYDQLELQSKTKFYPELQVLLHRLYWISQGNDLDFTTGKDGKLSALDSAGYYHHLRSSLRAVQPLGQVEKARYLSTRFLHLEKRYLHATRVLTWIAYFAAKNGLNDEDFIFQQYLDEILSEVENVSQPTAAAEYPDGYEPRGYEYTPG